MKEYLILSDRESKKFGNHYRTRIIEWFNVYKMIQPLQVKGSNKHL